MPLPLPTLLSQPLVAYTIEFDNEAEHRMPHRTTRYNDRGCGACGWCRWPLGAEIEDRWRAGTPPPATLPTSPWSCTAAAFPTAARIGPEVGDDRGFVIV